MELFRDYAKQFITEDFPEGVSYQEIPSDDPDWAIFETDGIAVANFMHRMEYRKNWTAELKEQYLYWNLDEKIKELEAAGLRVDYATEIVNTWIWLNWWRGRIFVTDVDGNKIDLPPNNALFHCTKPGPNDPRRLKVKKTSVVEGPGMFRLKSYHPKGSPDQIFDVIHVPDETEHFLVYEVDEAGEVWIYTQNLAEEPALLYHTEASEHHTSHYSGYTYKGFDDLPKDLDLKKTDKGSVIHLDLEREWSDGKTESFGRDYLEPAQHSHETHSVVPYFKKDGQVFVGFEKRQLAAVQSRTGSSHLAVIPAWRLPKGITSHVAANNFLRDHMIKDFDLYSLNVTPLGAGYFPSLQNTPERVTPFAVEVDCHHLPRDLVFIPLNKILEEIDHISDLHSKIALNRLAHALNQFPEI